MGVKEEGGVCRGGACCVGTYGGCGGGLTCIDRGGKVCEEGYGDGEGCVECTRRRYNWGDVYSARSVLCAGGVVDSSPSW